MMEGGTAANIVASSAWFYTDIRAIPTEDPMDYVARYSAHIAEAVVPRHEGDRAGGRRSRSS